LFNLDINLFQNNLEDLIETRFNRTEVDPDFGVVQIFEYTNITEAKTKGVELASSLHLSKSLNLNSGYTYLSATNKENGKRLPKRPRHQFKANLNYDTPDNPLALSFSMRWQSEEYFDLENQDQSPGYSVFDLSSEYRISDLVSLYAGIDNIGDKQRDFDRIHDLRPDEGRYVYLGLRLNQE
jgi:outer membrane receptor for ferrienterochelin and colicins